MRQIFFLLMLFGMAACTSQGIDEARAVVAQADSVRAAGGLYDDSLQLAQAYTVLGRHRRFHADEYAHACYHYGRLLREKDDPVAAMQCFLRAAHSNTHDLHILGRVYSNMGSICDLAEEYPLSYDMYQRSANSFLRGGDSVLYYYGINNMAFEMAVLGDDKQTLSLLEKITIECFDEQVLIKTYETKAELFEQLQMHDSAIYYANQFLSLGDEQYTGLVIKAQAYYYLNETDSALYYAKRVMDLQTSLLEQYNVLYILAHNDSTLTEREILELTSLRDDIHTYELDRQKTRHAAAVQVLRNGDENYRKRRRILSFVYPFILISIILSVGYWVRINYKHRLIKKETLKATEQNRILLKLTQDHIEKQKALLDQIEQNCRSLRSISSIRDDLSWNDYKKMRTIVDTNFCLFVAKLQSAFQLTEKEIRLCILVLIDGFSSKQMAELLFYAESGIRNLKSNTAKKLGTNGKEMRDFLLKIVLGSDS